MMNKKTITILIIILAIVVIAGGFWYTKNQNNVILNSVQDLDEQSQEVQKDVIPTKVGIQEKENDENIDTSNWKTYRNEKLGFEVKYPEKIMKEESLKEDVVQFYKSCDNLRDEEVTIRMRCDLESNISFGITKKNMDTFIEDYRDDCDDGHCFVSITTKEDYVLDGVSGKFLRGTNAEGVGALNYIFISKNDKNYIIAFQQLDGNLSSILETFKFIEK